MSVIPRCKKCGQNPRWVDKNTNVMYDFCRRNCPGPISQQPMCLKCGEKPRWIDPETGHRYDFCRRNCRGAANSQPMCFSCGVNPRLAKADGDLYDYCGINCPQRVKLAQQTGIRSKLSQIPALKSPEEEAIANIVAMLARNGIGIKSDQLKDLIVQNATTTTTTTSSPKKKSVPCWIYFQGESREFASSLKGYLISHGITCGMDSDFLTSFPLQSEIADCVQKSFQNLKSKSGIAIIIFNRQFFKDGCKHGYNPTDELIELVHAYQDAKLTLFPIWYKTTPEQVVVPQEFRAYYDRCQKVIGISNVTGANLHEIGNQIIYKAKNQ